jgi:hypothetical protein
MHYYQGNAYCWQSELPTTSYLGPLANGLPISPLHSQTQLPSLSQANAPTDLHAYIPENDLKFYHPKKKPISHLLDPEKTH